MESIDCPLTGKKVNLLQSYANKARYCYETHMTGRVCMTDVAFYSCSGLSDNEKYILSGICRNSKIKNEDPPLIDQKFLQKLAEEKFPLDFSSRCKHFINYLYNNGGKEYKRFNIDSVEDAPIVYSNSDELERIISTLKEDEELITYDNKIVTKNKVLFQNTRLTKKGVTELTETQLNGNSNNTTNINNAIDSLEIRIRKMIIDVLCKNIDTTNYQLIITGDSKTQVRNRINIFLEKHPNRLAEEFTKLSAVIQFCDIDHLKKIILKDDYWSYFLAVFKSKPNIEKYFDQLSELRHAVKHNREITSLVLLEGNAAIEWFNMII